MKNAITYRFQQLLISNKINFDKKILPFQIQSHPSYLNPNSIKVLKVFTEIIFAVEKEELQENKSTKKYFGIILFIFLSPILLVSLLVTSITPLVLIPFLICAIINSITIQRELESETALGNAVLKIRITIHPY